MALTMPGPRAAHSSWNSDSASKTSWSGVGSGSASSSSSSAWPDASASRLAAAFSFSRSSTSLRVSTHLSKTVTSWPGSSVKPNAARLAFLTSHSTSTKRPVTVAHISSVMSVDGSRSWMRASNSSGSSMSLRNLTSLPILGPVVGFSSSPPSSCGLA